MAEIPHSSVLKVESRNPASQRKNTRKVVRRKLTWKPKRRGEYKSKHQFETESCPNPIEEGDVDLVSCIFSDDEGRAEFLDVCNLGNQNEFVTGGHGHDCLEPSNIGELHSPGVMSTSLSVLSPESGNLAPDSTETSSNARMSESTLLSDISRPEASAIISGDSIADVVVHHPPASLSSSHAMNIQEPESGDSVSVTLPPLQGHNVGVIFPTHPGPPSSLVCDLETV